MALVCLMAAQVGLAGPLLNGNFDGGPGWLDYSSSGSATIDAGIARLETAAGTDLFSATLLQGDDGGFSFESSVTVPATALRLEFDVRAEHQVDPTEGGAAPFRDTFSISLYDAIDPAFDRLFTGDGFDFSVTALWTRVALDVTSLASREIAIWFDLSDEDDGFDTAVLLDNVAFVVDEPPVTVAEPGTLSVLLLGLLMLGLRRRRGARVGTGPR